MAKHILRHWLSNDDTCQCIEYWDDVTNEVRKAEIPRLGDIDLIG